MPRCNPPLIPDDTSPEVWRRQMAAIAAKSVSERLEAWDAHNQEMGEMEAAWIRGRHPEYGERQVFLAIVRHRYGDDLVRNAWPHEDLVAV